MSVSENASIVVVTASLVVPPGAPASASSRSPHGATCQAANAAPASCSSRRRESASSDTALARTLGVAVAERERHAAAGAMRSGAVPLDLLGHRRADGRDEGGHLVGADRLTRDAEVAPQDRADALALVEPVGPVPARERGEPAVELDAPVVGLPVLARLAGDREAERLGHCEPDSAAVVDRDVAFGVIDAQRVVLVAGGRRLLALTEVA